MKKLSLWLSFVVAMFTANQAFAEITADEFIRATETTSFTMYVDAGQDAGPIREAIVGSLNISANLADIVLDAGTAIVILTGEHAAQTAGLIRSYGGIAHTFVSGSGKLITIFVKDTASRMISGFRNSIGALAKGDICMFTGEVARMALDVVTNVVRYSLTQAHLAAKFAWETIIVSARFAGSILHETFKAAGTLVINTTRATWAVVSYAAHTLGRVLSKTVHGALHIAEAAFHGVHHVTVVLFKVTFQGAKAILKTAVVIIGGTVNFFNATISAALGIFNLEVGAPMTSADEDRFNQAMELLTGAVNPDNLG